MALRGKNKRKNIPIDFIEVALSRATGWTYWEIATQPAWFLEKLALYMNAEHIVDQIESNKNTSKVAPMRRRKYGR